MKKVLSIGTAVVMTAASVFGLSGCGQAKMVEEISYSATGKTDIIHKCEFDGKIQDGTKLIVAEDQVLLVYKNKKVVDSYTTGEHYVSKDNLKNFTSSEIYFLENEATYDIKWSTTEPISFVRKDYGDLELIGYGYYAYQFDDEIKFVETYLNSDFEGSALEYIANTISDSISNVVAASNVDDHYELFENLTTENIENNVPDNGVIITLKNPVISYSDESQQKINAINNELIFGSSPEYTTSSSTTAPVVSENTKTFKAQMYILTKEEDGRSTPIFLNFKPELVIDEEKFMSTCISLNGKDMVMPGEDALLTFEIDSSIEINVGDEIKMREGGRIIGEGKITKII